MPVFRFPVNLVWDDPGSPGVNVWHFRTTGLSVVQDDVQQAVDALHTFYTALAAGTQRRPYRAGLVISADFVTRMDDAEATSIDWTPITTNAAGGADAPMALQVCIGWRTSSASRRGRGRTFIGPLGMNCIDGDGTIATETITIMSDAATALIASSGGANDWAIGVWGLQAAGGGPESPHVLRDITSFRIRDTFAVLRSRRD